MVKIVNFAMRLLIFAAHPKLEFETENHKNRVFCNVVFAGTVMILAIFLVVFAALPRLEFESESYKKHCFCMIFVDFGCAPEA